MTEAQFVAAMLWINEQMIGRKGSVTLNYSDVDGLQNWSFDIKGGPKDVPALSRK